MGLTTTQLAEKVGLSKGRISQLVSAKKLVEGRDYTGAGRARRFNLNKCLDTLRDQLDASQGTGNGAKTQRQIARIAAVNTSPASPTRPTGGEPQSATARLNEARAKRAEIDLRRQLRKEKVEEGQWVAADEVQRATERLIGQEIAETESWLKEAARFIADKNGLNFKEVRADIMKSWRDHRGARADELKARAAAAEMTEREQQEDF